MSWNDVAPRSNSYPPEPADGSAVPLRRRLGGARPGEYMYVVDEQGELWVLRAGYDLKHSALLPPGACARSAGWLRVTARGEVHVNCASGHYMAEDPIFLPPEPAHWRDAMADTIRGAGFAPGVLQPGLQPLPGP